MVLSKKTVVRLTSDQLNIIGHMCYAAYKLWNVCNYERRNYKKLGQQTFPNYYYQAAVHKADIWYKSLPSQTAQRVCRQLDEAWKSFFALRKTGGVENPKPPRFKQENMPIAYIQNGIVHDTGSNLVRLSIPKQLKAHMRSKYGISADYLYLENPVFENTDAIKQIHMYPPADGECKIIVVYEIPDVQPLPDNGKYLAIDLGLHNLMTCLDSTDGSAFILGRQYLSICRKYYKEIARVQSQWYSQQNKRGVKYPKSSKHLSGMYEKKAACINVYLHKVTRYVAEYCRINKINTVVIGDIKGIRKDKDLGSVTNQKLHGLPYAKLYTMLKYKLALYGISLIRQNEAYSSQCSPLVPVVSRQNAVKSNRVKRGLYRDGGLAWNADCVGAYNILRLYLAEDCRTTELEPQRIRNPIVVKVAV